MNPATMRKRVARVTVVRNMWRLHPRGGVAREGGGGGADHQNEDHQEEGRDGSCESVVGCLVIRRRKRVGLVTGCQGQSPAGQEG